MDDRIRSLDAIAAVTRHQLAFSELAFRANEIGQYGRVEASGIELISKRLIEIGLPMDASAWQEMAVSMLQPASTQLAVIRDAERQVLRRYPDGRDATANVCGLAISDFGSANAFADRLSSANHDSADEFNTLVPSGRPASPAFIDVAATM